MDEATTRSAAQQVLRHPFWAGIKYEHLVSGVTGGVVSTLITHPFDLIKLRLAGEYIIAYRLTPSVEWEIT